MLILWVLIGCLMMCFIEYIVHRWVMHNRFTSIGKDFMIRHLILHHGRYFKDFDNETDPAGKYISLHIDWLFNLVGLSPVIILIMYLVSIPAGIIVALVIIFH